MSDWYLLDVTCADTIHLLNGLNAAQIRLKDVEHIGELELKFFVAKRDLPKVSEISEKFGATVHLVQRKGVTRIFQLWLKRPVILIAFAVMLLIALYLPNRILFVSVEGNATIPQRQILEAADKCGIRFGVSRRKVRSEVLKNALLQELPQLQWAGINTKGCTATISVREKTTSEDTEQKTNQVSSIVASRDGIIRSCTVYQGNTLCTVGQAVKAGQILVSGYTDCGLTVKATTAKGEIEALTVRQLQAISPFAKVVRGEERAKKTQYSIRIGKKLINLYKDSGNLDTTCVKIYEEKYVRLPGGFRLPVAFIKQTCIFYEYVNETSDISDDMDWLADFAVTYLKSTMIAGEVISGDTSTETDENAGYFYGKYICTEMIGRTQYEQTILKDEQNG